MKPFIKITKAGQLAVNIEFKANEDRSEWLNKNGFFESGGVFRHLDGRVAGLYFKDQVELKNRCAVPAKKTKSVWEYLLNA